MSTANEDFKSTLAKSFTELAIQNNCVILDSPNNEENAKKIAEFYNTIKANLA